MHSAVVLMATITTCMCTCNSHTNDVIETICAIIQSPPPIACKITSWHIHDIVTMCPPYALPREVQVSIPPVSSYQRTIEKGGTMQQ